MSAVRLVGVNPHSLALIAQSLMSLWLGLYILTHGAGNRASRLAAAAMLSLAGYFFAATMLLNAPLRDLAVFWARTMRLVGGPFFVFFLHMTVELLPPGNISRARRIVPLIYALAVALAIVGMVTNLVYADVRAAPNYDRPYVVPGPLYSVHTVFAITILVLSLVNLRTGWSRSTDPSLRRWFLILLLAFFFLLVGAAYLSTTLFLSISWPALLGHILVSGCLMLLGYSLAQQSALVEGRALTRDFLYSVGSAASGVGVLFSLLVILQRWTGQQVSAPTLAGVGATIISAFSLQNWVRDRADVLLYREEARRVRKYLRALARESDSQISLGPRLRPLLDSLCQAVGATEGRIVLSGGEHWQRQAIRSGGNRSVPAGHAHVRPPSRGLVVHLHVNGQRMGVVVLGCKDDGSAFTEEERILAQVLAERVVNILESVGTQTELLRRVADADRAIQELRRREQALQTAFLSGLAIVRRGHADAELGRHLRGTLRNLWDVPRLAKSPLVRMPAVQARLGRFSPGRALQAVLLAAIDRTKPLESVGGVKAVLRYEILRHSFVEGEAVREVTAALAISERQYYRELNAAAEAVQASLEEMNKEAEALPDEGRVAQA